MSKKQTKYSAEFKVRLVLEVLKGEKTVNQIASENKTTPKNIQNWKKVFLENAEIAMDPAKATKEYKDENKLLKEKLDKYAKVVGKMTVENEWLSGKLRSLDWTNKESLIEPKLKEISLSKQCELLDFSRNNFYYSSKEDSNKVKILAEIERIYEKTPIYGELKVHQQLLENGFEVCLNTVSKYRKELGLKAILAVKEVKTTVPIKLHKKYSYKLTGVDINRANKVWSTDITYLRINGGFVYLAAIIDWYSKAILSYSISNTMDTDLVMGVLNEALNIYGNPEIFNTDQGSQYTSHIHTKALKARGIIISMDGKGRAIDNICIERFWRSAKCERIYLNEYESLKELKLDVKDYIDFYNNERFHQTLNYAKPMSFYLNSIESNIGNYKQEKAA
jgi:putative transposase